MPTTPSPALQQWLQYAPSPPALSPALRWHVFISYRSVHRPWVINLYDVLRGLGFEVYVDQVALAPGDALIAALEAALAESAAAVLVWSSATAGSEWVRREYEVMEGRTRQGGFRFVPVRLDNAALPPFAARRVFLDFTQYPDGPNGGELLRLLHGVVGQSLSPDAARYATEQDEAAQRLTARVRAAIQNGDAARLRETFDAGGLAFETSPALGCLVAEGLTRLGDPDGALELLATLTQRFPRAIRPRQLRAHALSRRAGPGDLAEAQQILGELYAEEERDPETLGMYGRTWMDRYGASGNVLHLQKSRDLYAEAFARARDDSYTGVNAVAKSVLLGTPDDLALARELAARVQEIVGTEAVPGDYWRTATIAELLLIRGAYREAGAMYARAVADAPEERGAHGSTWGQACRLMAALAPADADRAAVRAAFAHLPDCPPAR